MQFEELPEADLDMHAAHAAEFFWWMVCHLYLPHFRAYQMLADLLCVTATACVLQKCLGLQYSHSLSRG